MIKKKDGRRKIFIYIRWSYVVPIKSSKFQFMFSAIGVIIGALGILFGSNEIFKVGVSFLFVGSVFMLKDLMFMINFK